MAVMTRRKEVKKKKTRVQSKYLIVHADVHACKGASTKKHPLLQVPQSINHQRQSHNHKNIAKARESFQTMITPK